MPLLDLTAEDLLRQLRLDPTGDPGRTVARLVRGDQVWHRLRVPTTRREAVGEAWKGVLDAMRDLGDAADFGRVMNEALLIAMLHIHAAFVDDGAAVTRSLNAFGLGWLGSWRELNIRLADQLYRHALHRTRLADDGTATTALRAALACWVVVEACTDVDSVHQRRRWRGMRGVSRLFLARRSEDPQPLLYGAVSDLDIAEVNGDRTPQHFCALAEVHLRAYWLSGDVAALDASGAALRRGRTTAPDSRELAAATGDLLRIRGMHALGAAGVNVARVAATATPLTIESVIDDVDAMDGDAPADGAGPPPVERALHAAQGAFEAAAMWYGHALNLDAAGRAAPAVIRIRRGQANLRAAHVRRLRGRASLALVERALDDLRLCHDDTSPICSDYLPWALVERGKLLLRSEGADVVADAVPPLVTAIDSFAEAIGFIERRTPDAEALLRRARAGGAEARLRLALLGADRAETLAALAAALDCTGGTGSTGSTDSSGVAATPLAYGGRAVLEPVLHGEQSVDTASLACADRVVDRLEAISDRADDGARRYAAGHAATLLAMVHRIRRTAPVDWPSERTHALCERAIDGDPVPGPLPLFRLARSAHRYARTLTARAMERTRMAERRADQDAAVARYDEAIRLYRRVAAVAAPIWAAGGGAPVLAGDAAVEAADPGPAVPAEEALSSMLGEALLRRDGLLPSADHLNEAVVWLERSIASGNTGAETHGLLGDAYHRRGRRRRDVSALRRAYELKERARQLTLAQGDGPAAERRPARESWSLTSAIAQRLWYLTDDAGWYVESARFAALAAAAAPTWAWPWTQAAKLAEADDVTRAVLPADPAPYPEADLAANVELWRGLRTGDPPALLRTACQLAVAAQSRDEFGDLPLGGVSKVWTVNDPHGLLSATLVFKPFKYGGAQAEFARTESFNRWLTDHAVGRWAATVRPVTIVPDERTGYDTLVTWRANGRPLADLIGDQLRTDGQVSWAQLRETVERCLTLLAHVHAWRGTAPGDRPRRMVDKVQRDLKSIGVPAPKDHARVWAQLLPPELPLAGKRDAHTENWLVTERGDVVALDVADDDVLPVGFEIAQFLEDLPLLPLTGDGPTERRRLAEGYLDQLAQLSPAHAGRLPRVDDEAWQRGYACFAARRALFACGAAARDGCRDVVARLRLAHARATLAWSAGVEPGLAPLVAAVEDRLRARLDEAT